MTEQHPITPPPELVEQWHSNSPLDRGLTLATQAAQWGADAELDACCEWLYKRLRLTTLPLWHELRAARRPKPKTKSPTDEELCEYYTKMYYKSPDRQGPEAQVFALRAVLEHWGK